MSVTVIADAIPDLESYLDRMPDIARSAARMAINDTASGPALTLARRVMSEQVNFPAGYLNDDRLAVAQPATDARLEAKIRGRDRPTSLARFAAPGATVANTHSAGGGSGLAVMVKPGISKRIGRGFLVRLKSGNLGLAIRLGKGETIQNRRDASAKELFPGVYLLYGPSVDQVFASVAAEISPAVAENVATEFLRQFIRLSEGA